jgi:hypothetical protein
MANRYDSPIRTDINITPLSIPSEALSQGLVAKQNRYDTIITAGDEIANQITQVQARPGFEDDNNFVKGLYNDFVTKRDDFVSGLEGNFSTTKARDVKELAQNVLLPNKSALEAIQWSKTLWDKRQEERAKYKAEGRALDFNNDLDTKPVINPDGTINVFKDTGIEKRGEWLDGLNGLFDKIQNNEYISKIYDDSNTSDDRFTYVKHLLKKINSNQEIIRNDGTLYSPDIIQSVIDNQVDEFIDADPDGNQMYRWFKLKYKEDLKASDPDLTEDELEARSHDKAVKRIKQAISDVGDKYRNRIESEEDLVQVMNNPNPVSGRSSGGGTGDEDLSLPVQLGTTTASYIPGSEYGDYSIYRSEYKKFDSPYDPNTFDHTQPYTQIQSIDAARKSLFEIGPEVDGATGQFKNLSPQRRGGLQMMDSSIGRVDDRNRATYKIKKNEVDEYISYLIDNGIFKKGDKRLNEIRQTVEKHGSYTIPTMRLTENKDGSTSIELDPYFSNTEDPAKLEVSNGVSQFTSEHSDLLVTRTAHLDHLKQRKRVLLERELQAMRSAGIATREEYEKLTSSDPNLKVRMNKAKFNRSIGVLKQVTVSHSGGFSESFLSNLYKQDPNIVYALSDLYEEANNYQSETGEKGLNYLEQRSRDFGLDGNLNEEFFRKYLISEGISSDSLTNNDLLKLGSWLGDNFKHTLYFGNKDLTQNLDKQYQKDLGKTNPRLKSFYENIESMENDYYVNGLVITIPKETTREKAYYKALEDSIYSVITGANNKLYKKLPDGINDTERSYNLTEAYIENGIIASDPDKDNAQQSKIRTNYREGWELVNFRFDPADGVVADIKISGTTYEVRGIESIHPKLVDMGLSDTKLYYMNQAQKSLKNNDMVSGQIGGQHFDKTDFFIAQFDDENVSLQGSSSTLKKGQYYIYEGNGNRLGFENVNHLINWHISNKDQVYDRFVSEATPLALPEKEFSIRYPGIDREEYKQRLVDDMRSYMSKALPSYEELAANGYDHDDLYWEQSYGYKEEGDAYLKPYSSTRDNLLENFSKEDIRIDETGRGFVQPLIYSPEELSKHNIASKNDQNVVVIPSLMKGLQNLKSSGFDKPITITHSIRSFNKHKELYTPTDPDDRLKYSPHMHGMAVDIRSIDTNGKEFIDFLQTNQGIKWLKDNKLRALVHKVTGGEYHIDLRYNVPVKAGSNNLKPSPYLFYNEIDGKRIMK